MRPSLGSRSRERRARAIANAVLVYAVLSICALETGVGLVRGQPAPEEEHVRRLEIAGADSPRPPTRSELALARVGASECGLACSEEELAAIAAVLRSRCPRCRLETVARLYSSRVFDTTRTDHRAWVAHLRADAREPTSGWPQDISWGGHPRERWLALLASARRVVAREVTAQCDGPVDHWGAPHGIDLRRATRAGWEPVDCGETRNRFWRVPGRER